MRTSRNLLLALACLVLPAALHAQPFQIAATVGDNTTAVSNLAVIPLPAPGVGAEAVATLRLTYTGSGRLSFPGVPTLLGSSSFTIDPRGAFPANIGFGQSIVFAVNYNAQSTDALSAQLNLLYSEIQPATGGGTTVTVSGLMSLSLVGTAPSVTIGYALPTTLNTLPIVSGETLNFPPTLTQSTVTATMLVVNQGSAAARLSQIQIAGADFTLVNLPLLPANVAAGGSFQFGIRFSPKAVASSTGQLTIRIGTATTITIPLAAEGVSSLLRYEATQNGDTVVIQPGGRIQIPDTRPGTPARLDLRVVNSGSVDATISTLSVTGTGFGIVESPLLPLTLSPGASTSIPLTFASADVGSFTGRLRVGTETFELAARNLGARLEFSYSNSAGSATVQPGGTIAFPTVAIGSTSEVQLTVRNAGNQAAPIAAIALQEPSSIVQVLDIPALPFSLAADASLTLRLRFSPGTTSFTSQVLRIDSSVINLTGQGSAPPALPEFRFEGASGAVTPLQQLQVGLTLAAPYPVALTGTLTIAVNPGDFTVDPAVQFSSGGLTVNFTIAANSTQAIFSNGSNRIRLQTGTVASTLTLTPRFTTTGGFDLTPSNPTTLVLTQAPAAPRILAATISGTAGGFTLTLVGYSNTRALGDMNLTLTPRSGVDVANPQIRLNLTNNSGIWYRTAASQTFGGQFQIQIPFTFSGGTAANNTLAALFQSGSVTIANTVGASAAFELPIQ